MVWSKVSLLEPTSFEDWLSDPMKAIWVKEPYPEQPLVGAKTIEVRVGYPVSYGPRSAANSNSKTSTSSLSAVSP